MLDWSMKHVKWFFNVSKLYINSEWLECTKPYNDSSKKTERHDIQTEDEDTCCIFMTDLKEVFLAQILKANPKNRIVWSYDLQVLCHPVNVETGTEIALQ